MSDVDLKAENAALRHRIEALEVALNSAKAPQVYRAVFGVSPTAAALLAMLVKNKQVSRDAAFFALYAGLPESDWPDAKILDVHLVRLRQRLRREGIEIKTLWGFGWSIDDAARQRLAAMAAAYTAEAA